MSRQTKEDIARLKDEFVEYYQSVPVLKYAAMAIGRDEKTVIRWRNEDEEFANRVNQARAAWVRKKVAKTRAEFALERLEKEIFAEKKTVTVEFDPAKKLLEEFGLLEGDDGREDDDVVQGAPEGTSQNAK